MPLDKKIEDINEADLQSLIMDEVAEGKDIEYKLSLPDESHEQKREFLADVSSFANASGGHLIFGMREEGGVPVELAGLSVDDLDETRLRLENLLRDNIEPRIPGYSIRAISLASSRIAIVIRVPLSWTLPHAVNFQRHWRFYSRNSAGKYPLDVSELRAAFTYSEAIAEQIKNFRTERLSKIVANETPIKIDYEAKAVLHIVPLRAFDPRTRIDFSRLGNEIRNLNPLFVPQLAYRYNLDGILTYNEEAYVQLFRNGIIEVVDPRFIVILEGKKPNIQSIVFERAILEAITRYFSIQEHLDVDPPIVIMLTLLNVRGVIMATNIGVNSSRNPIDREMLLLPEIIVDEFGENPATIMRPIFDSVWNATGWSRSMNYNEAGEWGKGPNFR